MNRIQKMLKQFTSLTQEIQTELLNIIKWKIIQTQYVNYSYGKKCISQYS